jgi:hypothetical protein
MIKTTVVTTRPNTNVQFFLPSTEYQEFFTLNYVESGKATTPDITFSDDGLIKTVVIEWESDEVLNDLRSEPIHASDYRLPAAEYNDDNGITIDIYKENIE